MTRKLKYREKITDERYGQYWETVVYGFFHGFGITKWESSIVVEVDFEKQTENKSRAKDAKESSFPPDLHNKGAIRIIPVSAAMFIFLDVGTSDETVDYPNWDRLFRKPK